jgi:hypothetical protein
VEPSLSIPRQSIIYHYYQSILNSTSFYSWSLPRYTTFRIGSTDRLIMSTQQASRALSRSLFSHTRPASRIADRCKSASARLSSRAVHSASKAAVNSTLNHPQRPVLRPYDQRSRLSRVNGPGTGSKRTIFIQTESTPNADVSINAVCHFDFVDTWD